VLRSMGMALAGVALVAAAQASSVEHITTDPWLRPAVAPAPADNAVTPARVELGRALFFDTRLSAKEALSCASCHNPAFAWTDGRPTAVGNDMKILRRSSPTILNAAFNPLQMWDGRKTTLEDQALGPFGPDEQNLPLDELARRVQSHPGYVQMFKHAYPGEEISSATIAKAIASFERTVLSTESPFDRWREGDEQAISASAKRGFELFNGKADCALCHQGFNFTDNGFHNIGLKAQAGNEDAGRYEQRKVAVLKGAFKTPTLRDVALTAPYMHNGCYDTLEQVVDHYDRGGDDKSNLSENIRPLHLSAQEKQDLVAFLDSLTGAPAPVVVPRLPL
jgi:cytochrome c peroxidase